MIIALVNFKGSTGKTTTALNLGAALVEQGRTVTLWDMDNAQGDLAHLSAQMGLCCIAPPPALLYTQIGVAPTDFHLIECPPRLDSATNAALHVADYALVPVQCEMLALRGLGRILRDVAGVNAAIQTRVLITMYSAPFKEVRDEIKVSPAFTSCKTVIPRSPFIAKAPAYGQSILTFAGNSHGARAYRRLAREVLKWR